ncbi:YnbE family lipoprotein [Nitrosomonas sp. JL21]|uniref:YnbE family lipoprotein n=1 Tax=Nitrosomonas sp. JL21 TaxID=153949 RepID=UPI00136D046A|nr:YnbE family lipoprotein [Nitrosomonas sp. JL21]MBL8497239.1 YnbE family lipoprotein [Nitrosomonas sp.]MXS77108.1 YnbE family lipoprotein [Nitrosomonas sp. JL21]
MRDTDQATDMNFFLIVAVLCCLAFSSCAPTVKVETPQEPITINLNIKLDADIRVKLEEEAKKDIAANPGIF